MHVDYADLRQPTLHSICLSLCRHSREWKGKKKYLEQQFTWKLKNSTCDPNAHEFLLHHFHTFALIKKKRHEDKVMWKLLDFIQEYKHTHKHTHTQTHTHTHVFKRTKVGEGKEEKKFKWKKWRDNIETLQLCSSYAFLKNSKFNDKKSLIIIMANADEGWLNTIIIN